MYIIIEYLLIQLLCVYLSNQIKLSLINILKSPPTIETSTLWRKQYLPGTSVHGNLTLSHIRTLNVPTPSYVQILQDGVLSVTSFSLLRKGSIMQFNLNNMTYHRTLKGDYLWPNELSLFHHEKSNNKILLVPDGFLMPFQSDGGLYAIFNPNTVNEQLPIRITNEKKGWFYHRAIYIKLPCGKEGILTARAHKPIIGEGKGELVWINIPNDLPNYNSNYDYSSIYGRLNNPSHHQESSMIPQQPWDEVILAEGPDVMFEIIDTNRDDLSIDIVAAHFFNKKITIHTIKSINTYPFIETVKTISIDTIGRPYGLCLATFDTNNNNDNIDEFDSIKIRNKMNKKKDISQLNRIPSKSRLIRENDISANSKFLNEYDQSYTNENKKKSISTHLLVSTHECSYDIPSAVNMAYSAIQGDFPRVKCGEDRGFRDGENLPIENGYNSLSSRKGGSLYAYEIPKYNNKSSNSDSKHWRRHTLFRGFKVRGWGGIFSPGAPGFPYVVQNPGHHKGHPLILLAGDCTGSSYIFSPVSNSNSLKNDKIKSSLPEYELAFEVECGATVGSVAVSENSEGSFDLFVPSYELNKVHVFRLRNNIFKKSKHKNKIR